MRRAVLVAMVSLLAGAAQAAEVAATATPTLVGVGYAVISSQPGRSDAQKRLMAMRASRLAAMRDLAEQVHGLRIDSVSSTVDATVHSDNFRAVVQGMVVGARTVRITPKGADNYETVVELDRAAVAPAFRRASR